MPGDDYIKTIKELDQVALLILMCWAVLVEPLGTTTGALWTFIN